MAYTQLTTTSATVMTSLASRAIRAGSGSAYCYNQNGQIISCPYTKLKTIIACSVVGGFILILILYYSIKHWRNKRRAALPHNNADEEHILCPKVVPPTDSLSPSRPTSTIYSPYTSYPPLRSASPKWMSTTTFTPSRPSSPKQSLSPSLADSPRPSADWMSAPATVHNTPRPSSPIVPLFR
ncbi:hypothetical protein HGRIS_002333 [Hohenbuehelia grisea]|uniref:Uncharacterized protein n=1 Tax=Hohenbuehelia grisea TaxID=104357 RepID=A0ABR3JLB7_9AGAR